MQPGFSLTPQEKSTIEALQRFEARELKRPSRILLRLVTDKSGGQYLTFTDEKKMSFLDRLGFLFNHSDYKLKGIIDFLKKPEHNLSKYVTQEEQEQLVEKLNEKIKKHNKILFSHKIKETLASVAGTVIQAAKSVGGAEAPAKNKMKPQNGAKDVSPGQGSPGRGNAALGKDELAGAAMGGAVSPSSKPAPVAEEVVPPKVTQLSQPSPVVAKVIPPQVVPTAAIPAASSATQALVAPSGAASAWATFLHPKNGVPDLSPGEGNPGRGDEPLGIAGIAVPTAVQAEDPQKIQLDGLFEFILVAQDVEDITQCRKALQAIDYAALKPPLTSLYNQCRVMLQEKQVPTTNPSKITARDLYEIDKQGVIHQKGDGNCLLYSFATSFAFLTNEEPLDAKQLRNNAMEYIETNYQHDDMLQMLLQVAINEYNEDIERRADKTKKTIEFLEKENTSADRLETLKETYVRLTSQLIDNIGTYMQRAKADFFWCSSLQLYALGKIYNVSVEVHDKNNLEGEPRYAMSPQLQEPSRGTVVFSYDGAHYETYVSRRR